VNIPSCNEFFGCPRIIHSLRTAIIKACLAIKLSSSGLGERLVRWQGSAKNY
jgi:hypothetical protein